MADLTVYQAGWQAERVTDNVASAIDDLTINEDAFLMLLTDSYTPDTSGTGDKVKGDIDANEVAGSATGYTAGGLSLPTSLNASNRTSEGLGVYIDVNDSTVTFTGADFSFRYAAIYDDGPAAGNKYLFGLFDFGSQTANNEDIEITIQDGILWTNSYA